MSRDTSQAPPVVPVSRPMTFSSGLWSNHQDNSPVKLPPLQIPLRSSDPAGSGPSSSTASPIASSLPSLDSRLETSYQRSLLRPHEGYGRIEQDLPPRSPERGQRMPPPHPLEPSQPGQFPAYKPEGSGSRPLQPSSAGAAPSSNYPPDAYHGAPYGGPRDTGGSSYSEPRPFVGNPVGSKPPPRLGIRQQPIAARACGFGERDRRLVDPPPILQLSAATGEVDPAIVMAAYSSTGFAVVQVSLWDEAGQYDVTFGQPTNRKPGGRLMGTTFTTSTHAKDENDRHGIFFAFSDLSCRTYGRFRLRFALMVIDASSGQVGTRSPVLDYAMSDAFTVYSASDFPGMRPSTRLTKALRESGCAIPVKKGRRSVFGSTASDEEAEEEEDGSSKRPKH